MAPNNTQIRVLDLALPIEEAAAPIEPLLREASRRLRVDRSAFEDIRVVRRALDARHRTVRYVYTIEIRLDSTLAARLVRDGLAQRVPELVQRRLRLRRRPEGPRPVVVGSGPAGLFAALTLAEAGWPPVLFERGRAVDERVRDVSSLYARGVLNSESNVCYGEGGAGTFSDGKLYTRINDPRVERVMEVLVERGADPAIRIDSRPHLGTDQLVNLVRALRQHLEQLGVTLRYSTSVERFDIENGRLQAVRLSDGERVETHKLVLATGHSAREVWEQLLAAGLPLEVRPFAVGFRIEHPQALINRIRYGAVATRGVLPAADYRLAYNEKKPDGRSVYSFCMCPGGVVVPTPTRQEELCINGMSHTSRSGRYANSALVATVTPEDFAKAGYPGVLGGMQFQQAVEHAAFQAGGGGFVAPASRVTDFMSGKSSSRLPATSYRRGLSPADLTRLYPEPIVVAVQRALDTFERSMPGFVSDEAVLIGVETRTSSPVRVPRSEDMQALGATGLYPAGEGMGYGGGIVSAAVDGMRAAEAVLQSVGAEDEPGAP